ncbi:MAG: SpoVR family protein, partial [Bdellovibrionales bacterium]|nr:SpoVR family protein [Bdellovibrionales bacterium]
KKSQLSPREEENQRVRLKTNRQYMESFINPKEFVEDQKKKQKEKTEKAKRHPSEPQKDVLLYLLDNAPLEEWQHTVLNIIRDEAYYFVPQMQTKIMNEGWASYWHSKIMTEKAMHDCEIVDFADTHSGAMAMNPGQMNPYKIGIELFRDIEERWDTGRFGRDWNECEDLAAKKNWFKDTRQGKEKI